ncbi:MAG: DUF2797 domain-containing protein [Egibacteraceae bacterium]
MTADRLDAWRFTGLYWEHSQALGTFASRTGETRARPVAAGRTVGWRVQGPRRCVGLYDNQSNARRLCPGNRSPEVGAQCSGCASADPGRRIAQDRPGADGTFPTGVFRLYLALFGLQALKVGLTAKHRADDRLLEQGAIAHLFLCEGSYLDIRRIEQLVSSLLGIPEQVQWRRKRALWSEATDRHPHAAVLNIAADQARGLLAGSPVTVLPEPTVKENLSSYGLDPEVLPQAPQVVTRIEDQDVLTGSVIGVIGKMLLLGADEELLVIDTRGLEGWQLRRCEPGQRWHLATPPTSESMQAAHAQPALFTL